MPVHHGVSIQPVDGNEDESSFVAVRPGHLRTFARGNDILRALKKISSEIIIDVQEEPQQYLIPRQKDADDNLPALIPQRDSISQSRDIKQIYPQESVNIRVDSYKKAAGLSAQRVKGFSKGLIIDLWV